ncbi:hypothetical protein CEUSTIGMA_g1584.t1 [Chlamydomonas eustigma]|uniref:sucrose-phosphate synthase n=1 Tax=Chlamydomonas eustigma TaxID=1157962 RepID=A0A250WTJ3_9CHLO|nr:hypothetical protein CEUSTIGMA_g1584.t1 [Chlamydomonas eustigma]|eukprot:GAX74135.1 hypothetical protein CEUSTIGMA_g1584.t1 [Chlamydomonas eustigma]
MELSTTNNAWVDSYLDALMSFGLSFEHTGDIAAGPFTYADPASFGGGGDMPVARSASKSQASIDADRRVAQTYYVQQVLQQTEESLRDAWAKTCRSGSQRDARLQYISWRAWSMKRKRTAVLREAAAAAAVRLEASSSHWHLEQGDAYDDLEETSAAAAAAAQEERLMTLEDVGQDHSTVQTVTRGQKTQSQESGPRYSQRNAKESDCEVHSAPTPSHTSLLSAFLAVPTSLPGANAASTPGSPRQGTGANTPVMPGTVDPLLLHTFPRLYIVLISMHGLVRGNNMELGRDADTGGQVKYVVELAKALGQIPSVVRVDLLTRLIQDPKVHASYGIKEEPLGQSGNLAGSEGVSTPAAAAADVGQGGGRGGVTGSYIVRLPCGPSSVYLRKEDLWPHIREFSDHAIAHAQRTLARLHKDTGEPAQLYMVHGHYADGGEVAACMSLTLGVPMALTGHSLGRNKREHLLKGGTMTAKEIEAAYKINRRIEAEERALATATVVFTSTKQEVSEQWGMYDGYGAQLAAALQLRPCKGYHVPSMVVVPPGLDFSNLKVDLAVDPWEAVLGCYAHTAASHRLGSFSLCSPSPRHLSRLASGEVSSGLEKIGAAPQDIVNDGGESPSMVTPLYSPVDSMRIRSGGAACSRKVSLSGIMVRSDLPDEPGALDPDGSSSRQSEGGGEGGGTAFHTSVFEGVEPVNITEGSIMRRSSIGGSSQAAAAGLQTTGSSDRTARSLAASMCAPGAQEPPIWKEVFRFLRNPHKPAILAMCRPDTKKNVLMLIRAYGSSKVLRDLANLVLVLGNRDILCGMAPSSQRVLVDVLRVVDEYDLYGQVAYPKRHAQSDISDIYLLATATKGVFVNVALQEPFGLTLIEAAAHGVPIVATCQGGPVDIVDTLRNGLLVDPNDMTGIRSAIISIITNSFTWETFSTNGSQRISAYSWPSHCVQCLRTMEDELHRQGLQRHAGIMGGPTCQAGTGPAGTNAHQGRLLGGWAVGSQQVGAVRHTFSFDDLISLSLQQEVGDQQIAAMEKHQTKQDSEEWRGSGGGASEGRTSGAGVGACAEGHGIVSTEKTNDPEVDAALSQCSQQTSWSTQKVFGDDGEGELEDARGGLIQTPPIEIPNKSQGLCSHPIQPSTTSLQADQMPVPDSSPSFDQMPVPDSSPSFDPIENEAPQQMLADQESSQCNSETEESGSMADLIPKPTHRKWFQRIQGLGRHSVQIGMAHQVVHKDDVQADQAPQKFQCLHQTPHILKHRRFAVISLDTHQDLAVLPDLIPCLKSFQNAPDGGCPQWQKEVQIALNMFLNLESEEPRGPVGVNKDEGEVAGKKDEVVAEVEILKDETLGVGLMVPWSYQETKNMLKECGVRVSHFAFLICDAGAMLWHVVDEEQQTQDANTGRDSSCHSLALGEHHVPTCLVCDEEYERHVDFRWDTHVIKQVLNRVSNSALGWGSLRVAARGNSQKATSDIALLEKASMTEKGSFSLCLTNALYSPFHLVLELHLNDAHNADGTQAGTGAGFKPGVLLSTIKRKLRRCGLVTQVLLTPGIPSLAVLTNPHSHPIAAWPGPQKGGLKQGKKEKKPNRLRAPVLPPSTPTIPAQAFESSLPTPQNADIRGADVTARIPAAAMLHITPLRASRSLALRFLSHRYHVPLSHFTLIAFSHPPVRQQGDDFMTDGLRTFREESGADDFGAPLVSDKASSAVRQSKLLRKQHKRAISSVMSSCESFRSASGSCQPGPADNMLRPAHFLSNDGEEILGGVPKVLVLEMGLPRVKQDKVASVVTGQESERLEVAERHIVSFPVDAGLYEDDQVVVLSGPS